MLSPFLLRVHSVFQTEVDFEDHDLVYNLTGLRAFTEYVIALRFRTSESRFWSNWSKEKTGMTMEEGKLLSTIPRLLILVQGFLGPCILTHAMLGIHLGKPGPRVSAGPFSISTDGIH